VGNFFKEEYKKNAAQKFFVLQKIFIAYGSAFKRLRRRLRVVRRYARGGTTRAGVAAPPA